MKMENDALIKNTISKNISLDEIIEVIESFKLDILLKIAIDTDVAFLLFKSGKVTNIKFLDKVGEDALKEVLEKMEDKLSVFNVFFLEYSNEVDSTHSISDNQGMITNEEKSSVLFQPVEKYNSFSDLAINKYANELLAIAILNSAEKAVLAISINSNNENVDNDFVICLSELFLNILQNKYIKIINSFSNEEQNLDEDVLVHEIDLLKDSTLELIKRVSNNYFVLLLFNSEFSKNKVFALKTLNKISSEFEAIL